MSEYRTVGGASIESDGAPLSPSEAVVRAVADARGVDPVEIPPLFDVVDPDALDALLGRQKQTNVTATFVYAGYDVSVHSNGTVSVKLNDRPY